MSKQISTDFEGAEITGTLAIHYPGCYRVRRDGVTAQFGQVKKRSRKWHAEIRENRASESVRIQYAGIWTTLTDAAEECLFEMRYCHVNEEAST